jgi:hypothetical protein
MLELYIHDTPSFQDRLVQISMGITKSTTESSSANIYEKTSNS